MRRCGDGRKQPERKLCSVHGLAYEAQNIVAQILVCSKSFARHKLNQNYINLPRDEKGNAKRRLTKISEILGRPGENGEGRVKSHAAFKPSGYRMNLRKRCDVLDWVIGSLGHWDACSQPGRQPVESGFLTMVAHDALTSTFVHAKHPASTTHREPCRWRRDSPRSTAEITIRWTPPASACCRSMAAGCAVYQRCTS
ncbi:hypothetical protein IQ06DRAFT_359256 [Phaeosphaeriaceae sp. SRC1lsM3a]|nr:hypothetical protein IQ06DRAFT_359256 [Stagonospora sp. SRC1lsM3a]